MNYILPGHDFFKPNDKFKEWLEQSIHIKYNHIIDMGAGRGLMTHFMQEMGLKVTGFDIHLRDNPATDIQICRPEIAQSIIRQLKNSPVLMIARPCHNGFANEYFKFWIHKCHNLFAYYIGLERNVENDLYGLEYVLVASNVGEDGENVYQVRGSEEKVKDFYLLKCWAGVYTIEDGEYVSDFPRLRKSLDEEVGAKLEGVVAIQQVEPDMRGIVKDDLDCGWIAPDGATYKVPYTKHSEFIYRYVMLDETDGSIDQWMKVWPPGTGSGLSETDDSYRWSMSNFDLEPNKAQIKALKKEFGISYKRPRIKELNTPKRTTY